MPDYAKTIIYKLINYYYPDLVYVGSMTNFTKRKQGHKERCLNEKCKKYYLKLYKLIRGNGNWDNWNMIKICDYPWQNRRQAEQEEDKYMLEFKANMNMVRAFKTKQQYREDNKHKINEKLICECGMNYTYNHKARHERTKKRMDLMNQIQ